MFVACGIWYIHETVRVSQIKSVNTVRVELSLGTSRSNRDFRAATERKFCDIYCRVTHVLENRDITPYPTGDKHTISTLLIKPIFSVLAHAEKQFFFKTSLRVLIKNSQSG